MRKLFLYSLILISVVAKAQEKDKDLPKGNEAFVEKKFADAEADFRISQSKNPKKAIASYNLGNSIYRQNQAGESKYQFAKNLFVKNLIGAKRFLTLEVVSAARKQSENLRVLLYES